MSHEAIANKVCIIYGVSQEFYLVPKYDHISDLEGTFEISHYLLKSVTYKFLQVITEKSRKFQIHPDLDLFEKFEKKKTFGD